MAPVKKAAPKKRRKTTPAKAAPKKRRKSTRRKGMSEGLRESFNLTSPTSAGGVAVRGALGGALSQLVTGKMTDPKKALTTNLILAAALVAMGQGAVAAGVAGVGIYSYMNQPSGAMAENVQYLDPSALAEGDEPDTLDANFRPVLSDGSNFELAEDDEDDGDEIWSPYFQPTIG